MCRFANRRWKLVLTLILISVTAACTSDSLPTPTPTQQSAPESTATATIVIPFTTPVPTSTTIAKPPTAMPTETSEIPAKLGGPIAASAVAVSPDGTMVVAVNPDSDSITVVDAISFEVLVEIPVGDDPRTVAITPDSKTALVANLGAATISLIDLTQFSEVAQYPVGFMPYGVVTDGSRVFIAEFGLGNVGVIDLATGVLLKRFSVDPFPAGLALTEDGRRLFITHFFTGGVTIVDLVTFNVRAIVSTGQDTNLSQFIAISPDGARAYLPQTRSNVTNTALLFDATVFPIVNVLDAENLQIVVGERITLDTADQPVNMPFAVALSPDGARLYLANAGSDDVSIIDLTTNQGLAHLSVGANPRGLAITPDGSHVFVNNVLDGTLSVVDTETITVSATILLTHIPLSPTLLLGKQIFNSASEPLLTTDNWISCATCHFDGMMDARTWLGFPDGPRNTPALFGVAETLPIHWSGDLDELQDLEITIRKIQFGQGLIAGEAHDTLGEPHAGLSVELDALAEYLASLQVLPSPYAEDKSAISRGEAMFDNLGCASCHGPPLYTDRQLHDVGTGDPLKEKNSHGRGTSFDTPTLSGLWLTAPYFHDGSAGTIEEVFQAGSLPHNIGERLNADELKDLVTFLLALPYGK